MAEFSKAYVISLKGEVAGTAADNNIAGIILEGYAGKVWLELASPYRTKAVKITTLIPAGAADRNKLIDATMAFLPAAYATCKKYQDMMAHIPEQTFLDFDTLTNIPQVWAAVREEIRPLYEKLCIYEALIK